MIGHVVRVSHALMSHLQVFDLTDEQKVEGANEIKLEEMRVRMVSPVFHPLCMLSTTSCI